LFTDDVYALESRDPATRAIIEDILSVDSMQQGSAAAHWWRGNVTVLANIPTTVCLVIIPATASAAAPLGRWRLLLTSIRRFGVDRLVRVSGMNSQPDAKRTVRELIKHGGMLTSLLSVELNASTRQKAVSTSAVNFLSPLWL
jgi:hypothetical protein